MIEVDVDATGQGEGHDERWRGEIRGPDERMDAALEVAVARQDGGDHEVVLLDRLGDRGLEGPAVADACRAAVAHHIEAQGLERLQEPRAAQVLGDRP